MIDIDRRKRRNCQQGQGKGEQVLEHHRFLSRGSLPPPSADRAPRGRETSSA
jgi:hypothetical protein